MISWHARRDALPDQATLEWVRRAVDPEASVAGVEFLPGGSVSAIHRVRLLGESGEESAVVVRRWVDPDWRENEPDQTPEHEARALRLAERHGIPAPRLIALRESDEPALVMSSLPGRSGPAEAGSGRPAPDAEALAEVLAQIHAVPVEEDAGLDDFYFYNRGPVLAVPKLATDQGLWRRAGEMAGTVGASPPVSLVHRDFNPGNVLWLDGRITGVVDWGAACWGPPQADVTHLRWNLAVAHDVSVADAFLAAYQRRVPAYRHDPAWDARGVLDLLPETELHFMDEATVLALEGYLRSVLR